MTPDAWRGIPLRRPAALDLFCGGGGAGTGLLRGGFATVVGVDIEEHRTSYEHAGAEGRTRFVRMDAIADLTADDLRHFDLVWASPPCQCHSRIIPQSMRDKHEARWRAEGRHLDLIPATRALLRESGVPHVIENVPGAPLGGEGAPPLRLCGTMFGLDVFRHRLFETTFPVSPPCACDHSNRSTGALKSGGSGASRPKTERCTQPIDGHHNLPADVERVRVDFPCRRGQRTDHIYRALTPELRRAFLDAYGRTYARSIKEVGRVQGVIVPMTEQERDEARRAAEETRKAALPPGAKQMYPVYGSASKHRGTTEQWRVALGCPWMTREELAQAVPPAYSAHIAAAFLETG